MLNGIYLANYGNHRDTRVTFGRMTALVGQNGAGKTNLLRAIMAVDKMMVSEEGDNTTSETNKIRSGAAKWTISASWLGSLVLASGDEQDGAWAVRFDSDSHSQWLWRTSPGFVGGWTPDLESNWGSVPVLDNRRNLSYNEELIRKAQKLSQGPVAPGDIVQPLRSGLDSVWISRYFKTAGSYLQNPSYSEELNPSLGEDCRDLAWVIAYLKGDKDEVFAEIRQALRAVVPTFRQVRHRPVPVVRLDKKEATINRQTVSYNDPQKVMGQELRFDMASGTDLPASAISEGTLVTLAILTAIIYDDRLGQDVRSGEIQGTKTILLDDIESGLHPSAQRDLVRQLRRLQETRPELQVIFSSHSPYIIDEMKPEEVWLFAPDKEGIAHCAKLSDHPDAKRALGVLTTGEFWSAEGESWVLDPAKRAGEEAPAAN